VILGALEKKIQINARGTTGIKEGNGEHYLLMQGIIIQSLK
jgi:hypothetical protein